MTFLLPPLWSCFGYTGIWLSHFILYPLIWVNIRPAVSVVLCYLCLTLLTRWISSCLSSACVMCIKSPPPRGICTRQCGCKYQGVPKIMHPPTHLPLSKISPVGLVEGLSLILVRLVLSSKLLPVILVWDSHPGVEESGWHLYFRPQLFDNK